MKDEIKRKLAGMFEKDQARDTVSDQAKIEQQKKEEQNFATFLTLRDKVIEPAMLEMADFLEIGEWSSEIVKDDGIQRDKLSSPRISMRFFKGANPGYGTEHNHPHFTVVGSRSSDSISFHVSTITPGRGGYSGTETGPNIARLPWT